MRGSELPYGTYWGDCSCPTARSGETAPRQRGFVSGAPCPVGHRGGDGKLCFTRGPQQISSSRCPPGSAGCTPKCTPKASPPCTAACLPRVLLPAALCLFFGFFCRALNCQLLFPDVSLWFSPCLAALLKIAGVKIPHRWCLRAAPVSLP